MNQKRLPKFLLPFIAVISATAFLFVNVHSGNSIQNPCLPTEITASQIEHCEDKKDYDVQVPDISLLSRVVDIVQKLLPVAH